MPKQINQRIRRQGEAVAQLWGPQFQAWYWSKCGELGPRRFIYVEVIVFGSVQDDSNIRCRRRPPLQMDDDDDHYAPPRRRFLKASSEDDVLIGAWTSPARDQGLP
jgi:hypothetical protein